MKRVFRFFIGMCDRDEFKKLVVGYDRMMLFVFKFLAVNKFYFHSPSIESPVLILQPATK